MDKGAFDNNKFIFVILKKTLIDFRTAYASSSPRALQHSSSRPCSEWLLRSCVPPPASQVHQETFGKSGCRRIVPGQYLAVDPKARTALSETLKQSSEVPELSATLRPARLPIYSSRLVRRLRLRPRSPIDCPSFPTNKKINKTCPRRRAAPS